MWLTKLTQKVHVQFHLGYYIGYDNFVTYCLVKQSRIFVYRVQRRLSGVIELGISETPPAQKLTTCGLLILPVQIDV